MKRLIIIATGLLKPHGVFRTAPGLPTTAEELEEMDIPDTTIKLFRWGTVEEMVDYIIEFDPDYLLSGCHSYGVSSMLWLAMIFWERFKNDKINKLYKIDDLVCFDGVYRDEIDTPQFKSLRDNWLIKVYPNVNRLWYYFQRDSIINGHGVKILNRNTTKLMEFAEIKGYRHAIFDQAPEPTKKLKQLAREGKP